MMPPARIRMTATTARLYAIASPLTCRCLPCPNPRPACVSGLAQSWTGRLPPARQRAVGPFRGLRRRLAHEEVRADSCFLFFSDRRFANVLDREPHRDGQRTQGAHDSKALTLDPMLSALDFHRKPQEFRHLRGVLEAKALSSCACTCRASSYVSETSQASVGQIGSRIFINIWRGAAPGAGLPSRAPRWARIPRWARVSRPRSSPRPQVSGHLRTITPVAAVSISSRVSSPPRPAGCAPAMPPSPSRVCRSSSSARHCGPAALAPCGCPAPFPAGAWRTSAAGYGT